MPPKEGATRKRNKNMKVATGNFELGVVRNGFNRSPTRLSYFDKIPFFKRRTDTADLKRQSLALDFLNQRNSSVIASSSSQQNCSCEDTLSSPPQNSVNETKKSPSTTLHQRKYSSAPTLAAEEYDPENFEQLVKKYNLFIYLGNVVLPPPDYCQNTVSSVSTNDPEEPNSRESPSLPRSDFICLTMNIEDARPAEVDPHYSGGHSIETVKGICGVPARLSGFFSWATQLFILVLSAVLTALIFLHIGGYAYFINVQNNSTVLDLIASDFNETTNYITADPVLLSSNETDDESENVIKILQGNESQEHQKVYHGPFEQIDDVQLVFGGTVVIDLLPCLRTINILYIVLCIIWLISLGGLLLSLKLELLDLFCPNIFFLMTAIVSLLIQALAIGILLFFQKEYNWPILLVISGTVGGLFVCFFLAIFAFTLLMVWYKYVEYMNNRKDACVCFSSITGLIKRRTHPPRSQTAAAADYTIPEATNHSHLPYIDEPPVQQFSNF